MHASTVLLRDLSVAHATRVWDSFVERRRAGSPQLMDVAVAQRTIRGGSVASLQNFTMDALSVLAGNVTMTLTTARFGNPGRVRVSFVALMASATVQSRMCGKL